jgi:organic radical activating enzyme
LIVTGGEPLLYNLDSLLAVLRSRFPDRQVHIETSGAFPYKGKLRPDWTTLSPKYTVDFRVAENVLVAASELKYVIDEHFYPEVVGRHEHERLEHGLKMPPVRLMPEGCPPRKEMVGRTMDLLRQHPGWRFGPRLQYDYPTVAEGEGLNNKQVTAEFARARAREHRRLQQSVEPGE